LDKLLEGLVEFIKEKKGEDIKMIDVEKISSVGKFIIIITATSLPHANALSKHVIDYIKENDKRRINYNYNTETNNPWQLIDAGDIIINIFQAETRLLYSLEKIYSKGVSLL